MKIMNYEVEQNPLQSGSHDPLKNMVLMFYMLVPQRFALTIKQYTPSQGKMVHHLYLNE